MPLSDVELSVALVSARTYLNDDAASIWSDAALLPKAQEACRELQTMLWSCGSPAVRATSDPIVVTASTVDITSDLPDDLLTPFQLWEYDDISETFADATPMTEKFYLPPIAPAAKLVYWCWKQEALTLVGASANRKVVVMYRRQIPIPAATTDSVGILFGELYIGARTAAIAHGSLGNADAYKIATDTAKANFQLVVAAQRGQQTPPMKP